MPQQPRPLTPKQQAFVAEYLVDLNGKQAAIRAGYSEKSAPVQAARLLTNANVQEAVAKGKAKQLETADLSATRILEELRRVALSDPRNVFTADGQLKAVEEWDDDTARAISGVKVKRIFTGEDGTTVDLAEVKFWPKVSALDTLAKHFGLLLERVEVTGSADLIERLAAGRRRAATE